MHTAKRLLAACLVPAAFATAAAPAWAAREPQAKAPAPIPAHEGQVVIAGEGCPANAAFAGLPIHSVVVQTPLDFLPWIKADLQRAQALARPLIGTPYNAERVDAVHAAIRELPFAQLDLQARVGGRVVIREATCTSQGLDLRFFVYAVKASVSLGATWEARQREVAAPEQQSGQGALRKGLRVQPRLGYQAGEGGGAGASARYNRSGAGADAYWRAITADGYASDRTHDVAVAMEGGREYTDADIESRWAHIAWRLAYADQSVPAKAVSSLGQSGVQAQLIAQTRPLGAWGLPLRLGALVAVGQHRSGGQDNPAAGLAADQHDLSLKLMAGTTARLERQTFAASYGVELGAGNGGAGSVDWVKQIVDIAHEGRWRVGDHRFLSLNSRLTLGNLSEPGLVPHSARFFAGGREQFFTGGEEWQIRSAPLLRSLGTNALAGTADTPGYKRFAALSLTAAVPVIRKPLVPAELSRDPQVLPVLQGQLDTAQEAIAADMRTALPAYRQAIAHLPQVQQTLAALASAVAAAKPPASSAGSAAFDACHAQVTQAQADVAKTLQETGLSQDGYFTELLPDVGSDTLGQAAALCVEGFNATGPNSAQIAQQGAALRASVAQLVAWDAAAGPEAAKGAASAEIDPVRHIVNTLILETNAFAVSPLLMLDVVTVGPRLAGAPVTRVGLGTGLRVTLVDSVDFSLGYMVNTRRQAGEARGSFFMTMEFKDPF